VILAKFIKRKIFHLNLVIFMEKIDVIMITKNSLNPCLKESLDSIFKNIPVNRLIVVDSFSSDGTVDLIKKYEKVKIIRKDCKRGRARQAGIKEVKTKWFAFVDSDVVLAENWFNKIKKYITPEVGAIEGNVKIWGRIQKIRPMGRAYTNCTLVRTSLVKDIKIPEEMSVFEDQLIRKHIEKKGFKWLKVSDPCSVHMSTSNVLRDSYEVGRMSGKYKLFPFWLYMWSLFVVLLKRFLGKPVDPRIQLRIIKGYVKGLTERF